MANALPPAYAIDFRTPEVDEYLRLRRETGLSPFTERAAASGLANSTFAVTVEHEGAAVGMGRAIGDGGLFFQLVDIAVLPAHQGKGLGKAIVAALLARIEERLEAPAYVSLVADGGARHLYAQFGFAPVAPKSIGMARWIGSTDDQPGPPSS